MNNTATMRKSISKCLFEWVSYKSFFFNCLLQGIRPYIAGAYMVFNAIGFLSNIWVMYVVAPLICTKRAKVPLSILFYILTLCTSDLMIMFGEKKYFMEIKFLTFKNELFFGNRYFFIIFQHWLSCWCESDPVPLLVPEVAVAEQLFGTIHVDMAGVSITAIWFCRFCWPFSDSTCSKLAANQRRRTKQKRR